MSDFLSTCLVHKPDDIFKFTKEYFSRFSEKPEIPKLVVLVGPFGVGKISLIQKLFKDLEGKIEYPVQHTTASKLENEVEGKDNYFISHEKFFEMKNKQQMLFVYTIDENYYGVSLQEVERLWEKGVICLIKTDIAKAKSIYNSGLLNAFYISIYPPNTECLRERMRIRGTDSVQEINMKLKKSFEEIDEMKQTNIFNYSLVNDDFTIAYEEFKNIFLSIYPELNSDLLNNIKDIDVLISEYDAASKVEENKQKNLI